MMHRFGHQAMATEFEIFCVHPGAEYAQQAAWAAFDLLDRIERELSRFVENSDVARIGALAAGESVRVSRWTMECLHIARAAYQGTAGAFDVSLGTGFDSLQLNPRQLTVTATSAGVRLDLGGIGKGYAVDRMADSLREWDIREALIHGGHSSVLAMDGQWPVTVNGRLVHLSRQAMSASGICKAGHILDPRDGQPVRGRAPVWVTLDAAGASPCAVAEAYSTACMILSPLEVQELVSRTTQGIEICSEAFDSLSRLSS